MFQISLVVFREVIEICLIISILIAATKNIKGRFKWILSGVIFGILASIILAFFTDKISDSFDAAGQELFNGSILIITSIMIFCTLIWMEKNAKKMVTEYKNIGNEIIMGDKPLYFLSLIVFMSILREGAEIALFLYSYFISGADILSIIFGSIVGLVCGLLFGILIYFGIIKFSQKYFFKITSIILIILICGLMSQGVGIWVNSDIVPGIINPLWDSSEILAQDSLIGQILSMLIGYVDRPSATQVIVYILSLFSVIGTKYYVNSKK